MPLPSIVTANNIALGNAPPPLGGGALAPLGIPGGPILGPGPGGAPGTAKTIPFRMEDQQDDNWCWSAVAVSIVRHYSPAFALTQCEVATAELAHLGFGSCCPPQSNSNCDQPYYLHLPLARNGNHYDNFSVGAGNYLAQIVPLIQANRPVAFRIVWNNANGLAHFVTIVGYDNTAGDELVTVHDPQPDGSGSGTVIRNLKYSDFVSNYRNQGVVAETIWTI